jgi:hypothetical protein
MSFPFDYCDECDYYISLANYGQSCFHQKPKIEDDKCLSFSLYSIFE